jgi:class 3 adenylate cyclase
LRDTAGDVNGTPPSLDAVTARLEAAGLPGFAWDAEWRLAWVSAPLKALLGESDDRRLGVGQHLLAVRRLPAWDVLTEESNREWLAEHLSLVLEQTPNGADRVRGEVGQIVSDPRERAELETLIEECLASASLPIPVRAPSAELTRWGRFKILTVALREPDGTPIGAISIGSPDVPVTLLVLLLRGEREMFDRMARLQEPSRREAALLFVDLEASGSLSRHLPSSGYFELIRALTTRIDTTVARAGGVVGKHSGDGASAFFLADELESPSAAAAATIEAAMSLQRLGGEIGRELGLEPAAIPLNIGAHWGGTLYIGQLTSGRLEVAALGDEVNECARVQESARGGSVLLTKNLLERLDAHDARRLEIDPASITYTTLSELEGISEKALRDAGTLSVLALPPVRP